jgi:hypothetical protein
MAKNNTILIVIMAVVALFFLNTPTGNYVSNYHARYDLSVQGCPQQGQMDCYYNKNVGAWTSRICDEGRWRISEVCDTLRASGDRSCVYSKLGLGRSTDPTITLCQNPRVGKEGAPNYQGYVNPQPL